jgi:hypothetical protein
MKNGIVRFQFVHSVLLLFCPFEPTGSTNYNIFPTHSIMQNKPKVKYAKINVNSIMASNYVLLGQLVIQTNKAKTNPIKANFKRAVRLCSGGSTNNV